MKQKVLILHWIKKIHVKFALVNNCMLCNHFSFCHLGEINNDKCELRTNDVQSDWHNYIKLESGGM